MKAITLLSIPLTLFLFAFSIKANAQCGPSTTPGIHVVQKGENLYRIAKAYNVSMEQMGVWNGIDPGAALPLCKALYVQSPDIVNAAAGRIPTEVTAPPAPAAYNYDAPAPPPAPSTMSKGGKKPLSAYQGRTDGLHILGEGETIADIAEFYGYSEKRFRAMNSLAPGIEPMAGSGLRTTDCDCNMDIWMLNSANAIPGPTASQGNNAGSTSNVYRPTEYTTPSGNQYPEAIDPNATGYQNKEQGRGSTNNNNATPAQSSTQAPASTSMAAATYMSLEERQMCNEVNLLRSNPKGYIKYIEEYIDHMRKNGEMGNSIATSYELIDELKKTPVLSTLAPAECIYVAARKHGIDQKPKGDIDHMGTDGSWPWDRVTRECSYMEDGNENLVAGPSDIRRAVILLLVDDGIDSRGHRRTLLDPRWKYIACHKVGQVGSMPNYWVQNFGF